MIRHLQVIYLLFICAYVYVSGTGTFKCALDDNLCWASYARLATNEYRRKAGILVALKPVELQGAITDAQRRAEVLAATGSVATREEAGKGCGWSVGTELVATVPYPEDGNTNAATECVKIWHDNPHTQGPLLDPEVSVYTAYGQAEKNGIVYCIQTFVNIHEDEECEPVAKQEESAADDININSSEEDEGEEDLVVARFREGISLPDGGTVKRVRDENGLRCFKTCIA